MKKTTIILLLTTFFSLTTNSQNNFEKLWIEVEKLEVDNLPKSALEIVEKIYVKANKEENSPQIIKALFYKSKFSLILEEDAQLKVIHQFKHHISKSKFPTKNVLENVLANLYWQYFTQHKYQFYNRTATKNKVNSGDFRTWDLNTLFKEIQYYFNASLANESKLQKITIGAFQEILQLQKENKTYSPTLYDFLANNALNFYKSSETSIVRPSYKFTIDHVDYINNASIFSTIKITSKDRISLQLNALKTYQKLIKFHIKEGNKNALAAVDLERLHFVKNNATIRNKEELFLKTLENARKNNIDHESSGLYSFEIAKILHQKATETQNSIEEKDRFKNRKALALSNEIIKKFPKSLGAKKSAILKAQILDTSLSIRAEEYIPINTNSRVLVSYKNIDQLYFSAYKISEKQQIAFNKIYKSEEKVSFLEKLQKVNAWKTTLRDETDYLKHTTEVLVPKLEGGVYLILASEKKEITDDSIYGTTIVQTTNLTLVTNTFDDSYNYQIVDRNNGKPIKNAEIHIKNHNTNHRYSAPIDKTLKTDKNGFASFKSTNRYSNVIITVTTKNDKASFGSSYMYNLTSNNNNNIDKETTIKAFIFTDRSIYRPGQIVYFKAIVLQKELEKLEVLKDKFIEVTLNDVNNQVVKTLELKLNEFGSVAGEFMLPNNGLTGEFSIEIDESSSSNKTFYENIDFDSGYISFSVEEYKRPKFKTEFKPITESIKVNDTVKIQGFAKSFSGANITDATVVYRVHRKVQYPSWYYWRRPNFNSEAQEIISGEMTSDDSGAFSIEFKAIPDASVSKENNPIFSYEITADVTDVNGETRSATTIVKVGYHSLLATISMDANIDKNQQETTLNIDTKNLNGEFVAANGTIKIYKLQAPKNPMRERPWSAPDYQDISENEFRKLFPNDPYSEAEENEENWKKGALVFTKRFDTKEAKEIQLKNMKNWLSGKYIAVLESEDIFGQEVKDEQKFSLFSTKENQVSDHKLFVIHTNKNNYKVHDVVEIQIGTASKDMTVVVQIEKNHKIIETCFIKLNNKTKTIKIPVNKKDIGGFAVKYHFVNYNYFKSGSLLINVSEAPKSSIAIETNIFRDKLQPGSKETWSFTIKDDKNDKVVAEMLASMYDASLDEFRLHNWQFNPISNKRRYYSYQTSNANQSFGINNFQIKNDRRNYANYPSINNATYNWFGFSFNNNSWLNNNYRNKLVYKFKPKKIKVAIRKSGTFNGTINGVITDEYNEPLPGVNILIGRSINGKNSDFDGNYSIEVKKGDILTFSYIGYTSLDVEIANFSELNIALKEDLQSLDEVVVVGYGTQKRQSLTGSVQVEEEMELEESVIIPSESNLDEVVTVDKVSEKNKEISFDGIQARKNFKETAFFFPQLKTDKDGRVSFSFTMPEALTKWKLQLLAHTKDLKSSIKTLQTVTQKELMVVPNAPRFLREGDKITLSTKITNLTNNQLSGVAKLILTDAITGKEIDADLENLTSAKKFTVNKDSNTSVSWNLSIPETVQAVQYKILAKAGDFSDGEQNVLPVLSNRMLVTETLPMWLRSNETKTFTLDKLKNNTSSTLKNHKLTLEMTSNPVWYAIQSLPYLMEYPYECAEQTFSKYYANTLASFIANSNPRIQEVFNAWKSSDALLSNLEKNEELKSLIIQETPWLRDAQSETAQKKRIALLFDLNKMKNEQEKALHKLQDIQLNSGGFPWFKGSRYENTFITQHIATGFGHLQKLGVSTFNSSTTVMIEKAVKYLDEEVLEHYEKLLERAASIKNKKGNKKYEEFLAQNHLNYFAIQYLYMRSFYANIPMNIKTAKAVSYFSNQSEKYWNTYNLYAKGQIALSLFRNDKKAIANKILKSLKENSITSDELGMYWKTNTVGFKYYQAPVETQALLIETFAEIENDKKTIDNLKIWLLKNKQTNSWKTTKATTEAVYALLLNGSDWVSITEMVDIEIGNEKIEPTKLENVKVEAGTGYFKTSWNGGDIKKEMATVTLSKKGNGIAWGSLYWQYFEDLDKITSAETPLKLNKKLFLKINSDTGKELQEINSKTQLNVGDLITVRIELRSDRDMEFIHMKDMRASGVEPISVLSKYKWQDNLGYYESTKDAATNFFFDRLPKGIYVFEYDVRVNNTGDFSNGITTIQSMYAPEFSSHSKGVRLKIGL
ncbi:MG2 domain-containing protein [Polaribacter sp. IC073]|uniref:alpha-2-macroglobulin family protein n=1 Tax=Polaribacter sp. IC073 TaxID=2508540 RepID=UPI0011BEFC5B|nr:MG2 domain-containing protein [Polaribacter sp. IC073]TXD46648.1 alpha-2-macroglobulin [Polaribacter sp. IC073]